MPLLLLQFICAVDEHKVETDDTPCLLLPFMHQHPLYMPAAPQFNCHLMKLHQMAYCERTAF